MGKGKLKNLFSSAKSTFGKISDKYNEMQEGNKPNSFEQAVNNLTDDIVIPEVPVEVNVPSWMKWLIVPAGLLLIWMMLKKNHVRRKRRQAKKRSYSRQSSNYRSPSTIRKRSMRYQKRSPKRRYMRRR